MGRDLFLLLALCSLLVGLAVANEECTTNCEAWRISVENRNIRDFEFIDGDCTDHILNYMESSQYELHSEHAVEHCMAYLSTIQPKLKYDGKDAWVFDIDDTLISTLPYFKEHHKRGEKFDRDTFEKWVLKKEVQANENAVQSLKHTLDLFKEIKRNGLKVFIISSRRERLRKSTLSHLCKVGSKGWSSHLMLRTDDDKRPVQKYYEEKVKQLQGEGFRIWGMVGSHWTSLLGHESYDSTIRTFKIPNSLYYHL